MPQFFLGAVVDAATHQRSTTDVRIDSASLTTHGVIVGQTGSGKTGLGVVLIEEALRSGIPVLLIDPKGDLGNLALTFPSQSADDFAPWVEGADAASVATQWKDGLASWGLAGKDIQALKDGSGLTIYTPGSNAGVGLNLVGSLTPPIGAADDAEIRVDEIGTVVSGLLGLMGIDSDPLSGREHILLTNLIDRAWAAGEKLDLAGLVAQIQQPPLRKLGVLELDTFYPAKDRVELALKLNGLLASPAFAAWADGMPLDIEAMLRMPDGRPRAAIVSLAHLSDEERQFAVAVVLGRLISWMRKQPGTSQLRALVYFDEVFGFVPPTAMPPTKKPILTLLKQARAFGVGLVLATQNPVDVDYKALSNATTWIIGRLQTERDRDRLLDGMKSAAGTTDIDLIAATISGLAKREFVLHRSGVAKPDVFTSRWSMSYLRGPLTRQQISTLMADQRANANGSASVPNTNTSTPPPSTTPSTTPSATTPSATSTQAPAANPTPTTTATPTLGDNEVPIMPTAAKGTSSYVVDPAAPWLSAIGAHPTGTRFEAALVARVRCLFDDDKKGIRETEEWEAVFHPVARLFDPTTAVHVDYDARDLRTEPPSGARFVLPAFPLDEPAWFKAAAKLLTEHLIATHALPIYSNQTLKIWSRIGETEEQFLARCDVVSQEQADREAQGVREKLMQRIDKVNDAVREAERDVAELRSDAKSDRRTEILSGAGELLGALLGGRRSARAIARSLGTASARRGRSDKSVEKLSTAESRVTDKLSELNELETKLHDDIFAIDAKWDEIGRKIETVEIALERTDVTVGELAVVWIPFAG